MSFESELPKIFEDVVRQTRLSKQEIEEVWSQPQYNTYTITQPNGKIRKIEEPSPNTKKVLKAFIPYFEKQYIGPYCKSVKGSSIVENAAVHLGARYILKADIKSCYQSISYGKISEIFGGPSIVLAPKCFVYNGTSSFLPTGAPTSPILCNIALSALDYSIVTMLGLNYLNKYRYTRYLDDITISTTHNTRDWEIIDKVKQLITGYGLQPNHRKCRWMDARNDSMIVTGVRVGSNKCTVPRKYWRTIRARLNNYAMQSKELDDEMQGCLAYIASVDPERYTKLISYWENRKNYGNRVEATL